MQCTIIRNSNEHNIAKIMANNTARGISYPAPRTTQPYSGGTEMEIMVVCLFCWCFGLWRVCEPRVRRSKKIGYSLPAKQTSAAFVCPPSDVSTHLPFTSSLRTTQHEELPFLLPVPASALAQDNTRQYNTGNSNREKVKGRRPLKNQSGRSPPLGITITSRTNNSSSSSNNNYMQGK